MATQKPLLEMMPDIVMHIEKYREHLNYNLRVFKILEGQLKKEVEDSLRAEILSPSALQRCLARIPSVNVLQKTTEKLSKVYIESPIRISNKKEDRELMDNIVRISQLDAVMAQSNRLMNAQRSCALEPYVDNGKQMVRVIPNHLFLPFSDDPKNPMNMTVFIKYLGSERVVDRTTTDKDGNNIEESKRNIRTIDIFQLFTDDEIIIVDQTGSVRDDWMEKFDLDGSNPFGVIPQTYINSSEFQLIPFTNQMGLDISVLIPKLLTDLNYSAQFMSHSIIWAKNVNMENMELNPDAIVNLGDGGGSGDLHGSPEIGTIDPKVDIEAQLQLIEFELSAYLSTVGIKAATMGSMMPGREASGFAKAMDESDTTAVRKEQSELYRHVERQFWDKMEMVQATWSRMGMVEESRQFSPEFVDSFAIKFAEMKILKTDVEKIEEVKALRELKLMTKKQALRAIKPDLTDEQIEEHLKELKEEGEDEFEEMMMGMPPVNPAPPRESRDQAREQRDEELGE